MISMYDNDPTLRLDDIRSELLGDEWLVLDAELLHDLDAWTAGRLQWTPAKAARTITRADSIDAILEGVRAGRLVPVYRGAVVRYGDDLEESAAALCHPSLKSVKLSGSDTLARDVVVTLRDQLAAAEEWSKRLQQSEEAQDFWNDVRGHHRQEAENAAVHCLFVAFNAIAPNPDSVRSAVQHMARAESEQQRLMFVRTLRSVLAEMEMVQAGEGEAVTA